MAAGKIPGQIIMKGNLYISNLFQPFETLRIGERYISGVYLAEIRQGKNIKTLRLVKM
jgi:hypothetical protein